jgi:hypothetical protein
VNTSAMTPHRSRDRLLLAVSAAQLAANVGGLAVALRRKHAYDFLMLHGRVANLHRDAVWMGTAFSAPVPMLVAQGWATTRLMLATSRPRRPARLVLGALGSMMIAGYLGESQVRRRLRRSNWDPVESSVVAAGLSLATAMAIVGLTARDRE